MPTTGFFYGQPTLSQCTEHVVLTTVVNQEAAVDTSFPSNYPIAWEVWCRGFGELEDLKLWIGDGRTHVVEFMMESGWPIE